MLCEKCGKMNDSKAVKCNFCGAPMPTRSGCGGFGDILDYEAMNMAKPVAPPAPASGSLVDPVEVKKLSAQVSNLKKSNKVLALISLGSGLLALAAIIISIIVACTSVDNDELSEALKSAADNATTAITDNTGAADTEVSPEDNKEDIEKEKAYQNTVTSASGAIEDGAEALVEDTSVNVDSSENDKTEGTTTHSETH